MINHLGTQVLKTKRLILRPFCLEDGEAMYRNWASDDEVTKYLSWPTHSSAEISNYVTAEWVAGYEKKDFYLWAIEFEGEAIGSISVVELNESVAMAEIGYCIGKAWWHRGIMPEALAAVMEYLFDRVGMKRIQACHDTSNPNSGAVMKKCGMELEGILRQAGRNNQGICDTAVYAAIRPFG